MIVMPTDGVFNRTTLSSYQKEIQADPYTPELAKLVGSATFEMTGYGMWNDSDPAPTLLATLNTTNTLVFNISLQSLESYSNYLFNITSANTAASIQSYLASHNQTLPFKIQLVHVAPDGAHQTVETLTPRLGENTVTFNAQPGVYVYGVLTPMAYTFNPYSMSNPLTGEDSGAITSLWGSILVYNP